MSRTGLAHFGVVPRTIVRAPARAPDGLVICPECGAPVGASKGTPLIARPDLLDENLKELVDGDLVTHGWTCERHQYDVVLPSQCHGPEAASFVDGWVGVELRFADEIVRWVATPEREVSR